jgi:sialidase-1
VKLIPLLAGLALFCGSLHALSSEPEKIDLFRGGEGGYALYRIPAIVRAAPHTILVACEARRDAHGDWGRIDLFMRRSDDDGRTWSEPRPLVSQRDLPSGVQRNPAAVAAGLGRTGAFTIGNPTWIADPEAGATHLLFCVEYSRAFIVTTRDGGRTFTPPREITAAFETFHRRDRYDWHVIATGPGHGIALASGRLVAPVWLSTSQTDPHHPSDCATIYSDDHGATWHAGEIAGRDGSLLDDPNESAVVEAAPGRVMLNLRTQSPQHRRAIVWSRDGATHWSEPAFVDDLWEPVCMAGLTRLAPPAANRPAVLLFSNPASLAVPTGKPAASIGRVRQNLTLRFSRDGGQTWPAALVLEPGPSAYSDLAVADDGTVLCFYERGRKSAYETLTLARIDPASPAPSPP